MSLYFAQNFKQLRRNADMTQEEIANALGVSPQAVSRWETGATYPDIELLPVLAEFFAVSIEELLGVEQGRRKAKAEEYKVMFKECLEHGNVDDGIAVARQAVREFPRDWSLQNQLMYALFMACSDDGNIANRLDNQERYKQEIVDIGENIIAHCTDDAIRLEAKSRLGFHYCELGQLEKGKAVFESLPTMDACKESMMYWALRGDERKQHNREMVSEMLARMLWNLWTLAVDDAEDYDTNVRHLLTYEAVIAALYDADDYGDWNLALARLYADKLAPLAAVNGKWEDMYDALQKSVAYFTTFAAMPEEYVHTSYFVKGVCDCRFSDTADSRTPWDIVADTLCANAVYDVVKNDHRFADVVNALRSIEYAE